MERGHAPGHVQMPDHILVLGVKTALGGGDDVHFVRAGLRPDGADLLPEPGDVGLHRAHGVQVSFIDRIALDEEDPVDPAPGFQEQGVPHGQFMDRQDGIAGAHDGLLTVGQGKIPPGRFS